MAPEFIKGRGVPFSTSNGERGLDALPDGSTSIRLQMFSPRIIKAKLNDNTLATLSIEKDSS